MCENSLDELHYMVLKWHKDRGILDNSTANMQTIKLGEEFGELCAAVCRKNQDLIEDSIGDMLVVLTSIANLSGTSLNKCLAKAYYEIKDRKGKLTPDGNFVKEGDYASSLFD